MRQIRSIAAFFVVLIFVSPIIWFAITAIKPFWASFNKDGIVWFAFEPTFENFASVLSTKSVFTITPALYASTLIAVGSTTLTLAIALPTAYGLSRFQMRFKNTLQIGILSLRFLPPIALIIPLFFIFNNIGLRDTHTGVILAHTIINFPIALLLMKSFFDEIPSDIDEMAMIEGATRFHAFRKIILPMATGGIAATAVLCFIFSWTEFLLSLFLTSSIRTLPVRIALYDPGSQTPLIAAAGTVAILPGIIFILIVQKHMVRGLTMGAIK